LCSDKANQRGGSRAERNAYTELPCPARYLEREKAVNADGGKHEAECSEERDESE